MKSLKSHAPRERVSWNYTEKPYEAIYDVTLHVSVWVEIVDDNNLRQYNEVTLHVSVWVEI